MTINRGLFTDYAALPRAGALAKYGECAARLLLIGDYLDATYATRPLGCYGVRDTRSGASISIHSFGRAADRSFRGVGFGSQTEKRRVMLYAIEDLRLKSKEWGVQAIHDYLGSRIWRSNRDPKRYPDGWKIQPADSGGMGQPWADWIHVEVHDVDGASFDRTPLHDLLEVGAPVVARPVIGMGSVGVLVAAVQSFLAAPPPHGANQAEFIGRVDGYWGERTQLAWNNYVLWNALVHPGAMSTDGYVNDVDWNLIAWDSGGWDLLYTAGFPRGI